MKSHKEVPKQQESRFFLLFLLNERRIKEAQKHTDPTVPKIRNTGQDSCVLVTRRCGTWLDGQDGASAGAACCCVQVGAQGAGCCWAGLAHSAGLTMPIGSAPMQRKGFVSAQKKIVKKISTYTTRLFKIEKKSWTSY
jgi:hypothetical protein